jgi:transcriptional regulator GlxA family with amidase domain
VSSTTAAPAVSIGCILADGFMLSTFARLVDFLRLAIPRTRGQLTWCVMSHDAGAVKASCDVRIATTSPLVDPGSFNYILVMGGPGLSQLEETTAAYLTAAAASGTKLVGLSCGSFILARLGLMRDRTCCVHPSHHQDFATEFPDLAVISDRHFLVDRDRITCGGGAGTAHLASYLIGQHVHQPTEIRDVVLLEGLCL